MNEGWYNPFQNLIPGFGPFSGIVGDKIAILLAVVWAAMLAWAAAHLIMGIGNLVRTRKTARAEDYDQAKADLMWPVVAIIGLSAVATVYGVLIAV